MAQCEKFAACPFYQGKMNIESAIGKIYRRKYCEGDKTNCARYKVATALGKKFVPLDLYPNMTDRANKILQDNN
ncbi:hypothetical protein IMX26_14415 [Clostridium sp. 'deep sea']|uniref:hypothetical protein n=1 Tax=Clostridium sp. 'deep sea' TaxID=2779445 RepID=UPI0018969938|nr:hypothetical protein [Clostridium sp. 'deep sea']QOR34651.1 hypothetical protein IMX26_14415 [Clostridium sp. 'deep sea']